MGYGFDARNGSHDLVLKNVKVPDKYFVVRHQGKKQAEGWSLHIPACYLGIATATRNYAVEFAKNYTPGWSLIAANP